jgi:hypothetical protein
MKAEMAHQKMSEIDPAEVHDYACRDAIATFRLAQIFWKKIEDEDLVNCHEKLILPLGSTSLRWSPSPPCGCKTAWEGRVQDRLGDSEG